MGFPHMYAEAVSKLIFLRVPASDDGRCITVGVGHKRGIRAKVPEMFLL